MDGRIILVIVVMLVLLALAGMFKYKSAAKVEFSFGNWLKFLFRGSNRPEKRDIEKIGINLETGAQLVAKEVVGGDKITYVHSAPPETSTPVELPKLVLRLFEVGRQRTYKQEIVISQRDAMRLRYCTFGLALENETESSAPQGIGVLVEFYWRGNPPQYPIDFQRPQRLEGWITSVNQLVNEQPAILQFAGPQLICFYGQPVEWSNFGINLRERLEGYVLVRYKISSVQPRADNSGELKINFAD